MRFDNAGRYSERPRRKYPIDQGKPNISLMWDCALGLGLDMIRVRRRMTVYFSA
jgi:hypothetical protein